MKKRNAARRPPAGIEALRKRLRVAEDTLYALHAGEVDALVVRRAGGEQVVALQGTDQPYRILLDQMYAGAVTMTPEGAIVYSNRRFAEIVRTPLSHVVGSALNQYVARPDQPELDALLRRATREGTRGEIVFRARDGTVVPVSLTFAPLMLEGNAGTSGVIGVIVDATERRQQEELRERLIEQVMTAQEEERARIARELHDETGQSLTALLVGLRTLEESPTITLAVRRARQLREIAARTLTDVGRLSRGLHPSVLDDLGLAAAVTRHVQEVAQLHGIAEDTRIEGLVSDPPTLLVQNTVYRVLQEALTNIVKYASARRVIVRLMRDEESIRLRVHDDGIGFDPAVVETRRGRRGLGLQGMRERVALLGGTVHIDSKPGKGTLITAHLPVRSA